jgi:diguanylate cyclase (GGDEF)-like protein
MAARDKGIADLIETVRRQRDEIQFLATHDALTGLPLNGLAMDRLQVAVAQAKRDAKQVAMLFIDLDGFKAVNDTFGHDAGDAVLLEIAKRLKASVREGDTVGRIAGDEFVVIAAGVQDRAAAQLVAEKLIEAVSLPILWGDSMLQVGASIGVSLYPEHGESGSELRSKADHAMYQVKRSGKNGVAFA